MERRNKMNTNKTEENQQNQQSAEQGRAYEQVTGDYYPGACSFCGGTIFVPHGHSYGACHDCGSI